MSFLRHREIYRSDMLWNAREPGVGVPPPVGRPPSPSKGRDGRNAPCSSSAMSFQLAIPWRVALQQSPLPLHQPVSVCAGTLPLTRNLQPTATCPLFPCLTHGVHSTQ